jgi:hypothetical protein
VSWLENLKKGEGKIGLKNGICVSVLLQFFVVYKGGRPMFHLLSCVNNEINVNIL